MKIQTKSLKLLAADYTDSLFTYIRQPENMAGVRGFYLSYKTYEQVHGRGQDLPNLEVITDEQIYQHVETAIRQMQDKILYPGGIDDGYEYPENDEGFSGSVFVEWAYKQIETARQNYEDLVVLESDNPAALPMRVVYENPDRFDITSYRWIDDEDIQNHHSFGQVQFRVDRIVNDYDGEDDGVVDAIFDEVEKEAPIPEEEITLDNMLKYSTPPYGYVVNDDDNFLIVQILNHRGAYYWSQYDKPSSGSSGSWCTGWVDSSYYQSYMSKPGNPLLFVIYDKKGLINGRTPDKFNVFLTLTGDYEVKDYTNSPVPTTNTNNEKLLTALSGPNKKLYNSDKTLTAYINEHNNKADRVYFNIKDFFFVRNCLPEINDQAKTTITGSVAEQKLIEDFGDIYLSFSWVEKAMFYMAATKNIFSQNLMAQHQDQLNLEILGSQPETSQLALNYLNTLVSPSVLVKSGVVHPDILGVSDQLKKAVFNGWTALNGLSEKDFDKKVTFPASYGLKEPDADGDMVNPSFPIVATRDLYINYLERLSKEVDKDTLIRFINKANTRSDIRFLITVSDKKQLDRLIQIFANLPGKDSLRAKVRLNFSLWPYLASIANGFYKGLDLTPKAAYWWLLLKNRSKTEEANASLSALNKLTQEDFDNLIANYVLRINLQPSVKTKTPPKGRPIPNRTADKKQPYITTEALVKISQFRNPFTDATLDYLLLTKEPDSSEARKHKSVRLTLDEVTVFENIINLPSRFKTGTGDIFFKPKAMLAFLTHLTNIMESYPDRFSGIDFALKDSLIDHIDTNLLVDVEHDLDPPIHPPVHIDEKTKNKLLEVKERYTNAILGVYNKETILESRIGMSLAVYAAIKGSKTLAEAIGSAALVKLTNLQKLVFSRLDSYDPSTLLTEKDKDVIAFLRLMVIPIEEQQKDDDVSFFPQIKDSSGKWFRYPAKLTNDDPILEALLDNKDWLTRANSLPQSFVTQQLDSFLDRQSVDLDFSGGKFLVNQLEGDKIRFTEALGYNYKLIIDYAKQANPDKLLNIYSCWNPDVFTSIKLGLLEEDSRESHFINYLWSAIISLTPPQFLRSVLAFLIVQTGNSIAKVNKSSVTSLQERNKVMEKVTRILKSLMTTGKTGTLIAPAKHKFKNKTENTTQTVPPTDGTEDIDINEYESDLPPRPARRTVAPQRTLYGNMRYFKRMAKFLKSVVPENLRAVLPQDYFEASYLIPLDRESLIVDSLYMFHYLYQREYSDSKLSDIGYNILFGSKASRQMPDLSKPKDQLGVLTLLKNDLLNQSDHVPMLSTVDRKLDQLIDQLKIALPNQ